MNKPNQITDFLVKGGGFIHFSEDDKNVRDGVLGFLKSADQGKILIVSKKWKIQAGHWQESLKQQSFFDYTVIEGTPVKRFETAKNERAAAVHIIDFSFLKWLIENDVFIYETVIFDGFENMKNFRSVKFKIFKSVLRRVKRVIGTSSAPLDFVGLWAQMFLIDKSVLSFYGEYMEKYFYSLDLMGWNMKLKKGSEAKILDAIKSKYARF